VYRDLVSGPSYVLKEVGVSDGAISILGTTVAPNPDWNSITSNSIDVNSGGIATVSGLVNGSTSTDLFIGTTRPMTVAGKLPGAVGLRPQIADSGETVIRDGSGRILTYTSTGIDRVIADSTKGFGSDTGNRPGISADGSAVGFLGNKNGSGQGIYAFVTPSGLPSVLVEIAGIMGDGFSNFTSEQRVGINADHYTFDSGASEDDFTIVFQGSLNGVPGVYARDVTIIDGIVQPLGDVTTIVTTNIAIDATKATVTGFNLYRPINNDGTIVFTITLSDNSTAIVQTSFLVAGIHESSGKPSTAWANAEYDSDGIRFFIQDAWDGHEKFGTTGPLNYTSILNSEITGSMIGAYAVISLDNGPTEIPNATPTSDQTGALQIDEAFKVFPVATYPLLLMSIDAEVPDLTASRISQVATVARYADAIAQIWSYGVPSIIYTNKVYWNALTGGSTEIQGIPLWDADSSTIPLQSLGGFNGYGGWTQRLGRQWSTPPGVLLGTPRILVDRDVFDATLLSLPRPAGGCKAAISVGNLSIGHLGNALVLSGNIYNDGRNFNPSTSHPPICPALATRINQATLLISGVSPISGLQSSAPINSEVPLMLNTIPTNGSAGFVITFLPPVSVASGTEVAVHLSVSCGGVKFPALSIRLSVF
jgi:hypothetical protein